MTAIQQVSIDNIRDAAALLEPIIVPIPLREAPRLSQQLGVSVLLKCENLQPIGAFKLRGAYTAIARLAPDVRSRGVITYSSGNHGLAVSYSADLLGIRAVVVMPENAPKVKVDGVRQKRGEVVFAGTTTVDRRLKAEEIVAKEGLVMIPPFENQDVIAGQATCALEIIQKVPDLAAILVPVGGGGLLAGTAACVAALKKDIRVIGVEPVGAPKLTAALKAGRPVALEKTDSIADGLKPLSIGDLPWSFINGMVQESITVEDDEIVTAMRYLHKEILLRVEPSGGATTAALMARKVPNLKGPVAAIVSGGNVDVATFGRLVH